MRKMARENIIVVCTIVLCFMLTLALCVTLSGEGFLSVFKQSDDEGECYFAICTGGYTDVTLARNNAQLIRARGGAGYVSQTDGIEIVFAVYKDKQTADNALESLKDKSAYIKQIDVDAPSLKWCDGEVKNAEVDALKYFDIAFDMLFDVADKLNKNEFIQEDAKAQIKVLYAQIEDIKSAFYTKVASCDDDEITQTKLALITTLALLDNIDFSLETAELTACVRYQIVQLTLCRQALMKQL